MTNTRFIWWLYFFVSIRSNSNLETLILLSDSIVNYTETRMTFLYLINLTESCLCYWSHSRLNLLWKNIQLTVFTKMNLKMAARCYNYVAELTCAAMTAVFMVPQKPVTRNFLFYILTYTFSRPQQAHFLWLTFGNLLAEL